MTTVQEAQAAVMIGCAIVEACRERGADGAPGGHLYAALIGRITLEAFNQIMFHLENTKLITKRGECYFYTGPERVA